MKIKIRNTKVLLYMIQVKYLKEIKTRIKNWKYKKR